VIAAGVLYSLHLQTLIRDEVFNVGDAGVKALMSAQFARGEFSFDLRLPAEPWLRALWDQGLYPFQPPHVYLVEGRRYIRFSLLLPLLTAPLVRALGFRGFYLLPLVSTWLIWRCFERASRGLRASRWPRAAALACLVFASHLTYYSATFWEHTPAVGLGLAGVALVLARPFGTPPPPALAFRAGLLVGVAAWFREETLFLVAALLALGAGLALRPRAPERWQRRVLALWAIGLLLPATALLAANVVLYGHPAGIHGLRVVQRLSDPEAISGGESLRSALLTLGQHFPLLPLCAAAFFPLRYPGRARALQLLLVAGLVVVAVPLLVRVQGKEWGPRFLLPAVPLLCLVLAVALERVRRARAPWLRAAGVLALAALLAPGAWRNTYLAARQLEGNYAGRLETLRLVQGDDRWVVAVSHQFVAEQLAAAFDDKAFLLAPRIPELKLLGRALAARQQYRFLYLCDPNYGCGPLGNGLKEARLLDRRGVAIELRLRGPVSRYLVYDGVVVPAAPDPSALSGP
jgi:hypothetical protein